MSDRVSERRDGRVAVLTIDNPPANALGQAVRAGLLSALDRLADDPSVDAIVISGAGSVFATGTDVGELGAGGPALSTLCERIEQFPRPVVACLSGSALGGGLELALAAWRRVAAEGTQIGFPEVTLGLVPGAGGTFRAPRLVGAGAALDLMLSGRPVPARRALDMGFVDFVEAEPEAAAITLARDLAGVVEAPRDTGFADPADYLATVRARRAALAPRARAEARIVDCVEAALLLPPDEAREYERTAFEECLDTAESRSLRHATAAERLAWIVPGLDHALARPVRRVGLVGGGVCGSGIAAACLAVGLPVVLTERDEVNRDQAAGRVETLVFRDLNRGRIGEDEAVARLARLIPAVGLDSLGVCDLVIEAVPEDLALKRAIFADLERWAPGAVLATATDGTGLDTIAAATTRPERVMGLHFFAPEQATRAVEVVAGEATAAWVLASGFAFVRRLGRAPVHSVVSPGFIGNRVYGACRMAMDLLMEEGASPGAIDAALRAAGLPFGPYQAADLAGLDRDPADRRLPPASTDGITEPTIAEILAAMGRVGRRAGAGFYSYHEGAPEGVADPEVARVIAAERARRGITPRTVTASEIRRRAFAAMANEGARAVSEGVALRPSDVDVALINGFGFPRHIGGPMQWADETGLLAVRSDLNRWSVEDPRLWMPPPIWDELIKNGLKFADLGPSS